MNRISSILVGCFLGVHCAFSSPLVTGEQLTAPDGKMAARAFHQAEFLTLPPNAPEVQWRVRNGVLQSSTDGASWTEASPNFLQHPLHGNWEEIKLGSVTAVGQDPFLLNFTIGPGFDFTTMVVVENQVFEFGRKLVQIPSGDSVPQISVFKRDLKAGKPEPVASFRLNEESLQYRLGTAFPISDSLIALQAGTEHPFVNSITLFDTTAMRPVGYLPYSEIQFLPGQNAFRVAEPLTRAMDTPEAVEEARRTSRIIPILQDGKLNPELAESELFTVDPQSAAENSNQPSATSHAVAKEPSPVAPSAPAVSSPAPVVNPPAITGSPNGAWKQWTIAVLILLFAGGLAGHFSKRHR